MPNDDGSQQNPILEILNEAVSLPKPVIDTGMQFLADLLGGVFRVSGNMLKDQVYSWQVMNRIRIAQKAKKKLDESGLPAASVPPGFLVPLIDNAGNAEEPTLQEMWANLLVSSLEDEQWQHPAFIKVLSELSPKDARILNVVYVGITERQNDWVTMHKDVVPLNHVIDEKDKNYVLNIRNLKRLDLVALKNDKPHYPSITQFGKLFCNACIRDSSDPKALEKQVKEVIDIEK